ncbi:MAG: ATP-binding protein [Flexilinea sp.]
MFGPSLESFNLVMVYLMAVVISAIYLNRGPAILTSVVGVLAFNFFFIKPIFTFTVYDSQYLLTFMALVMVGIIISNFAVLLRDQVVAIRGKENQTQSLLNLSRELNAAISLDQVLNIAIRSSRILLNRECVILLPQNGGLINKMAAKGVVSDADDLAVAEWAFNHAQPAGSGTETLPESLVRFVPLRAAHGPVGVLGIRFDEKDKLLKNDQRMQLEGFVNLIALAVERANFVDAATRQEMMKNTEKLQTALLNSISHELRTPLASITGVLTTLSESEKAKQELNKLDPATRIELLESATDQAKQLNRLVENLLNTTRLEAGSVHLDLEYCDMEDLIGAVLQQFKTRLDNHPMKLEIPGHLPLITCDPVLISQVINNLLDNACKYSPPGSSITIGAVSKPDAIEVFIRNSGSVLAEDELEKIFSKFYRSSRHNKTTGTGLGLSICKGIVEAHGGWIKAYYEQEHNLTFCFSLPVNLQKEPIHE